MLTNVYCPTKHKFSGSEILTEATYCLCYLRKNSNQGLLCKLELKFKNRIIGELIRNSLFEKGRFLFEEQRWLYL